MSLFLSLAAFLLSISAVIIGIAVLRRINLQNEDFLQAYVVEIRNDLLEKEHELKMLRLDFAALRSARAESRQTLNALEQDSARKRQTRKDLVGDLQPEQFAPNLDQKVKRHVA